MIELNLNLKKMAERIHSYYYYHSAQRLRSNSPYRICIIQFQLLNKNSNWLQFRSIALRSVDGSPSIPSLGGDGGSAVRSH